MTPQSRQFMLTAAWLFARHGRPRRARVIVEALVEDDPTDGVAAAALAELLLSAGEGASALKVLAAADFPSELSRAEAILETRALAMTGRKDDSERRWRRYLASQKGSERSWVEEKRG